MKRRLLFLMLLVFIFVLTGCDDRISDKNLDVNSIFVNKDNSVIVAVVEKFDKEYYSEEELRAFIEAEIAGFNTQENQIDIQTLSMDNQNARLVYKFKNSQVFNDFNENEIHINKVSEILNDASNKLPGQMISAKKDANKVDKTKYSDYNKYKIVSVSAQDNYVQVKGKIHLYSENVTLINKNTIKINNQEMAYIIYK